jgi:hypothetical protein
MGAGQDYSQEEKLSHALIYYGYAASRYDDNCNVPNECLGFDYGRLNWTAVTLDAVGTVSAFAAGKDVVTALSLSKTSATALRGTNLVTSVYGFVEAVQKGDFDSAAANVVGAVLAAPGPQSAFFSLVSLQNDWAAGFYYYP